MPHPYVSTVTFKDGQIVLTVQLDEYLADQPVEVSGYATQNSGGFATFYAIQSAGANPDGTVVMYVRATPEKEFMTGEDVTVSLRAAKVWITVLTEDGEAAPHDQPGKAPDGTAWNHVKEVGWASAGPMPSWGAGRSSGGGDSTFPGA